VEIRCEKFWICVILSGIVCNFLIPSRVETKDLFIGFRQGKESNEVPEGWEVIPYFRTAQNTLSLYKEGKRTVLRVRSLGSASGVLKRLEVDLKEFPVFVWAWKINRAVGMAIETNKDRNDAAARIRVIFGKPRPSKELPEIFKFFKSFGLKGGSKEPVGYKIDYIWGNAIPHGEVIDYPGSKRHKMVVVQSGNERTNQWVWEKRNLMEDFEKFFRHSPPPLIGIAVLTDTDQTNEGVIAHYSSIVMMSEP